MGDSMASDRPLVSIVTPSFNQARYIEATVKSVLEQDYSPIEYIVIDGQSTDGTLDILKRYDGRLTWISEPDAGQSDAIRKGLSRSRGQILTWLNSDDTLEKNAVSTAVNYLEHNPEIALVYGNANFIDAQGQFIAACAHIERFRSHRLLHYSDFIVQPAAFFRREEYDAVGGLDPSLHYAMDYDLWLKLAAAPFEFAYIPQLLANYRWLGENKSAVGGWERIKEVERVARRYGARRLPAYFRLEAINLLMQEANEAGHQGKYVAAGGSLMRAAGSLVVDARAMRSLLSPRTWRIIRTGRVLRAAVKA
jgi:glycosyltransferase involved in cell wall biosynthesis